MSELGHELELERELALEAPPGEPPPQPVRPARPLNRASVVGALLCLAAAVLTTIGTLQVLITIDVRYANIQSFRMVITAWEQRLENADPALINPDTAAPSNGVPLLVGTALLLVAAVLLASGAIRPAAGNWRGRAGVLTAVAAAAFVVATAGNIALQVRWWAAIWDLPDEVDGGGGKATVGPGLWTSSLAAVLAVAAAVVAVIAWRAAPRAAASERTEPDTQPLGIPVLVRRLEDAPPDESPADYR
jgi:hypothetical protein